jgi:hypothetical protein
LLQVLGGESKITDSWNGTTMGVSTLHHLHCRKQELAHDELYEKVYSSVIFLLAADHEMDAEQIPWEDREQKL